ncbi:MAG TPA: helix-turn-helix transcriptional regulator [Pirellulales bacterium]|nr:helix-turn-helix transcriptional regulator [Pirellulales bacterium]
MSKAKKAAALSEQIRAAVVESGLTINAVAVRAGVNQSVLHRFVIGKRDLRLATADKLAAFLGLTLCKAAKIDAGK